MNCRTRLRSWLQAILRRERLENDMETELRFHLDAYAEDLMRGGVPRSEAMRRANIEFGGVERAKEECRDARGVRIVESLMQDARFSVRQIRKNPGFTCAIVLTVALGMGANTAVFSVLQRVVLRPLPYKDAARLVTVWQKDIARQQLDKVTVADYNDWETRTHVFADIAFSWDAGYTLTGTDSPRSVVAYQFSSNFFSLLGARPLRGRTFLPEEGTPGRDHVVVLSHHLWRSRFGSDDRVVGRAIQLDGEPYEVIGVMPPEFAHPSTVQDLWTPLPVPTELIQNRGFHVLNVVARLRPGVSLVQAQQELQELARANANQYPQTSKNWSVELDPIRDTYTGGVRPAMWILQCSVLLLLIIACANVGNMLLARAGTQDREVAIRLALGANRGRLFRQFLTQGMTLAILGAGAGMLMAWWGVQALPLLLKAQLANIPLPAHTSGWMDWRVLILTLAIVVMTSLIFGAIPAFHKPNPSAGSLNIRDRGPLEGRSALRFRRALIVGQVALSVLLVVGAGLLIQTFVRLQTRSLGFDTEHVLTCVLSLSPNRYPDLNKVDPFLEQALAEIRGLPGVESAGAINTLPLSGMDARRPFSLPGEPDERDEQNVAQFRVVTPDYFRTMRIPLREGRFFEERDRAGAPLVAIINEKLAHRLWADTDPIGKRLLVPDTATPLLTEVVGVVGDVRHGGLASEPPIEIYRPAYQTFWPFYGVVIRSSVDGGSTAGAIRQAVWSVDKDEPIDSLRSMEALAADSVALRRSSMLLLAMFAGLAVSLAAIGIYSLISYTVVLRTHEIGVRIALGARQRDILKSVVGQTALLALAGLAIGLIAAVQLAPFLSSLLFGVTATDLRTFVTAASVMMIVAAGAAYIPARRAARVDPLVALRYE